jgi:DNA-binding GntR family transcriptional regulator
MTDLAASRQSSTALNRAPLPEQIADAIRRSILAGEYIPGQRLVETEMARGLSVSQGSVREALRRLAHEGIVMQVARRGTFVATVGANEARKAYELRAVLERVAAEEFCAEAPDSVFPDLRATVEAMRAAARSDDLAAFVEADMRFHRSVWEASGHPLLPRIWPLIEATVRAFTTVSNQLYFGGLKEIAQTHVPLLDALRRRDRAQASQLFHDHVVEVWRRIEKKSASKINVEHAQGAQVSGTRSDPRV